MNNFRAIAIVLIVMGHTFSFAGMKFATWPEKFVGNLISGGTALFVFISGFLFFHVFYSRFNYKTFLIGKFKNVAVPYLLLSIAPIIYSMLYWHPRPAMFDPTGPGIIGTYVVPYAMYLATGAQSTAYWYIPFVLIIFLMAPMHVAYIRSSTARQLLITAVLLVVAALVQRPHNNFNTVQSVLVFTPVYLFGITVAMNKDFVWKVLTGKEWLLALGVVAFNAAEIAAGHFSNYHKDPFLWGGFDLMLFQKLFMCLFFLQLLHRFEGASTRLTNLVATTSFAIFFLHPGFLKLIHTIRNAHGVRFDDSWSVLLLATTGVLVASVLTALAVAFVFGKYSRYLIGHAGKGNGIFSRPQDDLRPA